MAAECEWRVFHPGIPATQVSVEELCTQQDGTLCRQYLLRGSLLGGYELSECCSGDCSQTATSATGRDPMVASSPLASCLPWLQVCSFYLMPLEQKESNR